LPFSGRVHSYPQFIVRKVPKGVEQLVLCFTGGIEFPILQGGIILSVSIVVAVMQMTGFCPVQLT